MTANRNLIPVKANTQIAPATATNAAGTNHVLTITVHAFPGTVPATATPGVGTVTNTAAGGSATASKTWADAKEQLALRSASNKGKAFGKKLLSKSSRSRYAYLLGHGAVQEEV